jgi:hypothetical protein
VGRLVDFDWIWVVILGFLAAYLVFWLIFWLISNLLHR